MLADVNLLLLIPNDMARESISKQYQGLFFVNFTLEKGIFLYCKEHNFM